MRNIKLFVSCLVLGIVTLFYVATYAQTTIVNSDNKSCCASCACCTGEGSCADGACKMKDKHASHANMKGGECCKMKGEKAANAQSGDKKEGCCDCCAGGSCCAEGECKMKDKKDAATAQKSTDDKESCCVGGSGCGCCQKKAE